MVPLPSCMAVVLLITFWTSSQAYRLAPAATLMQEAASDKANSSIIPRFVRTGGRLGLQHLRRQHPMRRPNNPEPIRIRRFNNNRYNIPQRPQEVYNGFQIVPRRNVNLMLQRKRDKLVAYLLRDKTLGNINPQGVSIENGVSEIQVGTRIQGSAHRGGVFPDLLIDGVSASLLQNMGKYIMKRVGDHSSDFSKMPTNRQLVRIGKGAVSYAQRVKREPDLEHLGEVPGPESLEGTLNLLRAYQVGLRQVLFKVGYDDVIKFGTHNSLMRSARKNGEPVPLEYWLRRNVGDCRLHAVSGSLMMKTLPKHIVTKVRYVYAVAPEQGHWSAMADHAFIVYRVQLGSKEAPKFGRKEVDIIADKYNRRLDGRVVNEIENGDRLQLEITPRRLVRSDENTWDFDILPEDASRPTLERADAQLANEELWSKEVPENLRIDVLPYPEIQNPRSLLQSAADTQERSHDISPVDNRFGKVAFSVDAVEAEEWYRPFLPMEQCTEHSQCLNGICMDNGICSNCGTMVLADAAAQRWVSPVFQYFASHYWSRNLSLPSLTAEGQSGPSRSEFRFVPYTAYTEQLGSQGSTLLKSVIRRLDKDTQEAQIRMLEDVIEHGFPSQHWQDSDGNLLIFDHETASHVVISLKGNTSNDNANVAEVEALQLKSTTEQWFNYYTGVSPWLFATASVQGSSSQRQMTLQCQSTPEIQFACPLLQLELLGWRLNSVPYEQLSLTRAHIKRGLDHAKIEGSWSDSVLWHVREIIDSMTDGKILLKRTSNDNYEACTTNQYAVRLSRKDFLQSASKLKEGMEFLPTNLGNDTDRDTGSDNEEISMTEDDWAFDRYTGKRWVLDVKGTIFESARSLGLFEAWHAIWDEQGSVFWLDDQIEDVVHTPVFRLKCLEHAPPDAAKPVSAETCVNGWSKVFQYLSHDWN